MAVGRLTKIDMNAEYGSSAVVEYPRYIFDPERTKSSCSRLLTKRYLL